MSAIGIQQSYAAARVYAPPLRPARLPRIVPPAAAAPVTATAIDSVRLTSDNASGLAAVSTSLDPVARVSNELAIADDHLAQIGELFTNNSSASPAAVDDIVRSARFASRPLLDGSYSATVNGQTLALPSFLSRDLTTYPSHQIQQTRQDIDSFRSSAVDHAAYAASDAADNLLTNAPVTMDASTAYSAALLIRARALLDPASVSDGVASRAQDVLALIR